MGEVELGEVRAGRDFVEASELYARTFAYQGKGLTLNSHLLSALVINGGVAVAARDQRGRMIGFAYGFPGWSDGTPYLYSQALVVADEAQGRHLGRRLKSAQREAARARGLMRMRWAFDPLLSRNAHFNLDVLGAEGVTVVRDMYDTGDSDRLVVDWDLDADWPREPSPRPSAPDAVRRASRPGTSHLDPPARRAWVTVPATPPGAADRSTARSDVASALEALLAEGYRAVGCGRVGPETSAYVLIQEGIA